MKITENSNYNTQRKRVKTKKKPRKRKGVGTMERKNKQQPNLKGMKVAHAEQQHTKSMFLGMSIHTQTQSE